MTMLRGLRAIGFDTVCATPHQKAGQFLPSAEAIAAAHLQLVDLLAASGLSLRIPLAAENMWDATLYERIRNDAIPSYDGGPSFLVEFLPAHLPVGLNQHIFDLRRRGKLPVIAHPERYQPLWSAPDKVLALAADCALVVDLPALAGYHGRREGKAARALVEGGLAHAVASDVHSPSDLRGAAEGVAWIKKRLGEAALARLLDENPRRILAGEHPES